MNTKTLFTIFVLLMYLLVGCDLQGTPPPVASTTGAIASPTPPTIEKAILPSADILKFEPVNIRPELPSDVKPVGSLAIWDETIQLVHFDPEVRLETIPGIDFDGCLSTSPDGKWLAYCPLSDDSPTGQWLIVQAADQQEQKRVPMDMQLIYLNDHLWLDSQRLIFPIRQDQHRPEPYPMMAINPFTGQQVKLDSNYPGFHLSPWGPASSMEFGYSDVVYDPSLNLVIFPSAIGGAYIVLWDRQSKSVLAKINGSIGQYPLWSPDASQFAIPLRSPKKSEDIIEEWFRVSRDGQVEQLTHFAEYFTKAWIAPLYSWSPDGQKLAFWLEVSPSLCSGLNLAILDVPTKEVTDTCIAGLSDYAIRPVWSLDSRYVAMLNSNTESQQTVLVDVEQGQAFRLTDITSGLRPIGWMVSP